ncbi:hypothetical protein [Oryzifoliimicrobium ureilyticus]|uniref:hypothetical protein n=1 Tax=Oryzifoliimicrobium ureilyticus TaxID=3113724 RepID=UPI0030762854
MRLVLSAVLSVALVGSAGMAFAQPLYSSDDGADSNHATPHEVQAYKSVTPHQVGPVMYSDDGPADTNFATPHPVEHARKIDTTATASTTPLPDCNNLYGKKDPTVHTRGGISGASSTDACRSSD